MKHTYKQKIEILNNILTEYAKYFIYFDECKCYLYDVFPFQNRCSKALLEHTKYVTKYKNKPYIEKNPISFCIEFTSKGGKRFEFLKRKPFLKDIDKIIARYRSKLSYEREKNELKIRINDAIEELEFTNKLKSIMI